MTTHQNNFGIQGPYAKAKRRLYIWRRLGIIGAVLFTVAAWFLLGYGWHKIFWL